MEMWLNGPVQNIGRIHTVTTMVVILLIQLEGKWYVVVHGMIGLIGVGAPSARFIRRNSRFMMSVFVLFAGN
jgi:hypothetical protein